MLNPFEITVYDKSFQQKGFIGNPKKIEVHVRHNLTSTAIITVDGDHGRIPDLLAPGSRILVGFNGAHLMGGPVRQRSGQGPSVVSTVTVIVEDDFRLLTRILGWPVPTVASPNTPGAIAGQTVEYDKYGPAPAETVVKHFVSRNATRLGLPVTIAPDQGRGAQITASMRMHRLAERLYPAVDQAGIGVTVRQNSSAPSGLTVDCYAQTVHTQVINEASGIVTEWSWDQNPPMATRVVLGGPGEGTARAFRLVRDTARETEWGDVIEEFRDTRDDGAVAVMEQRAQETLTEGAPTYGLKIGLSEAGVWQYGRAFNVGDVITHEIAPGAPVTDVLREVVMTFDADATDDAGGLIVRPIVGDRTGERSRDLLRAIEGLYRGMRNIYVRS